MTDTRLLLNAIDGLPAGEPAILATVVRVAGSSYRLPGARLLVDAAGRRTGSVSGGCLEADIARRGRLLNDSRPNELVRYDGSDPDAAWSFGLGCNGSIDIFIERLCDVRDAVQLWRRCARDCWRGALVTVFGVDCTGGSDLPIRPGHRLWITAEDAIKTSHPLGSFGPAMAASARESLKIGSFQTMTYASPAGQLHALVEPVLPPLPLVIFGAGYDAVPLTRLAKSLGWHVTVCDRRASHARADHFPDADVVLGGEMDVISSQIPLTPDTVAVVMSHSFDDDSAALAWFLESPAKYIGVLGPKERTRRMLETHVGQTNQPWPKKVYGPVGLDIGADGPEQVALAVVSEIVAAINGRTGASLRERQGPIHQPSPAHRVTIS